MMGPCWPRLQLLQGDGEGNTDFEHLVEEMTEEPQAARCTAAASCCGEADRDKHPVGMKGR